MNWGTFTEFHLRRGMAAAALAIIGLLLTGCAPSPVVEGEAKRAAQTCSVPDSTLDISSGGKTATFKYGYNDGAKAGCMMREVGGKQWADATLLSAQKSSGGLVDTYTTVQGRNVHVTVTANPAPGSGGSLTFEEK
ncbi:hypothetical protein SCMU_39320 [Sinomonas cyclohexanicum]|uniref:Uncharacterized protein n=1 Tax=Sinomonas cyclohexanicum TaxID=322009 RepID=A0ABM7Q140_SINCY|nr:hypothetical protein [Corynebacterium cyclohexanicum]BCT78090.1 hypothetical protein SCMU_39320 [Corynebacterium cyclohexanicum]